MKNIVGIVVGSILMFQPNYLFAQSSSMRLEIQPGSLFESYYAYPSPLIGFMEFGPEFVINEEVLGEPIIAQKLTHLQLASEFFHFHLNPLDESFSGTFGLPGPSGLQTSFQASLDMFDEQGEIIESKLYVYGILHPAIAAGQDMRFASLSIYRNSDPGDGNVIGLFTFTATVVPEPAPLALFFFAILLGCVTFRGQPSKRIRSS